MIANTSAIIAIVPVIAPGTSSFVCICERDSGTAAMPAMQRAAIGAGTQNTPAQPIRSTRTPPTSGPKAIPKPIAPAQIPIARPRSSRGNTAVRIDSV